MSLFFFYFRCTFFFMLDIRPKFKGVPLNNYSNSNDDDGDEDDENDDDDDDDDDDVGYKNKKLTN